MQPVLSIISRSARIYSPVDGRTRVRCLQAIRRNLILLFSLIYSFHSSTVLFFFLFFSFSLSFANLNYQMKSCYSNTHFESSRTSSQFDFSLSFLLFFFFFDRKRFCYELRWREVSAKEKRKKKKKRKGIDALWKWLAAIVDKWNFTTPSVIGVLVN